MKQSETAIILLHEIYGVNAHLREQEQRYTDLGCIPYILDLSNGNIFPYANAQAAYDYFFEHIGFEAARDQLLTLAASLKQQYKQIYVVGYSVGATVAWLCASHDDLFTGIICFYGSRIRDYTSIEPRCPVLLLNSVQESRFDLSKVEAKKQVELHAFTAPHGFVDRFSDRFDEVAEQESRKYVKAFLENPIGC